MKLSIIVPVYNTEKYIDECLSSCINQTYKDYEIILVDDGSNDNSYNMALDYSKKDNRKPGKSKERIVKKETFKDTVINQFDKKPDIKAVDENNKLKVSTFFLLRKNSF